MALVSAACFSVCQHFHLEYLFRALRSDFYCPSLCHDHESSFYNSTLSSLSIGTGSYSVYSPQLDIPRDLLVQLGVISSRMISLTTPLSKILQITLFKLC